MSKLILLVVLAMAALSLACDVAGLVQPNGPAIATTVVQQISATSTSIAQQAQPTLTSTPTLAASAKATVPPAPTNKPGSTPAVSAPPLPPGWQLVVYTKDPSCSLGVPGDWKVEAKISSGLKTDQSFTNGTVSVALASTTDWEKFKKVQTDTRPADKVVETSNTRLWLDGVGDGKTTQAGSYSTFLAVRAADGRICTSIMGTDGKAAASWRDVLTKIAQTVAFR